MAIVTWNEFQSLVTSDLPGCPWLSIKDALVAASIEFFERSKAWRTEPAVEFDTVIDQSDYTPTLPGRICRVNSVHKVGGYYLQKIRRGFVEPWDYTTSGTPKEYLEKNDTTITIFPTPDAVHTLAIDCCLVPDRNTATGIEDYLFQAYAEYIASGAVFRLAAKPAKKPWSNPDLAAYHQSRFESGIALAIYKDMQGVAPRARPRMF